MGIEFGIEREPLLLCFPLLDLGVATHT